MRMPTAMKQYRERQPSGSALVAVLWFKCLALAAGVAVMLCVAGCASTDSDLPWAMPSDNSPSMPGMPR